MLPYGAELLVLALSGLLVSYGLGSLLLRLAGERAEEPFYTLFLRLLTGLLALTAGYALARTGGRSILLPLPFLLGTVVWLDRATTNPAQYSAREQTAGRMHGRAKLLVLLLTVAVFVRQYARYTSQAQRIYRRLSRTTCSIVV